MSYWDIIQLMRKAKVLFPDFWPPWIVSSWQEEEERETEQNMALEHMYWEEE